ncbi:YhgE/Pip domain-containing protein [Pedococcus bigeumensis]|uniref:YhgE/Pip domain-containing protein n=1 Tax=Pedococcus bigeumensis TaxID=433644 RepID=A0A502CTG9_9MICO|nr:YhgE/Pip domain-containing protein [Pedococcus bigeumensis]TPG16133.1 YhgE/Pip domain-containing protein [Pedococcus bigeumensis]
MTAIRLALTELRRITAGRLPRAALFALVLVPTLYGGLYLYANKDPYGGLERVPAAVVVEDAGTTLANGEDLAVGNQVASELADSRSFGWHRVSRAAANRGVEDGTYNFALIVPRDFSAALASSAEFTPRQAQLEIETNDANNYLSRTIANQLVAQVTKSVASQVSSTAASQLLVGFTTIHDKVSEAADGAAELANGARKAADGAGQLEAGAGQLVAGEKKLVTGADALSSGASEAASGADRLSSGATALSSGLSTLDQRTSSLSADTRRLANGAQQVADGNAKVAASGRRVASAASTFVTTMTTSQGALADRLRAAGFTDAQVRQVLDAAATLSGPVTDANSQIRTASTQLDQLSAGAAQVATGADQLADAAGPLHTGIHQAASGSSTVASGASELAAGNRRLAAGASDLAAGQRSALDGATALRSGATELAGGLGRLDAGAVQLHDGLQQGLRSIPDPSADARKAVAQTLGNPVGVKGSSLASAATYGAGLAPFFLSLALWIGAYVLFLLVKPLSSRALAAGQPSWRTALGGWLAPAALGVVQSVLVYAVVLRGVGISAQHPVLLLGFMVAVSMTFVMILHALAARLGSPGKFLGLVFMVLQLVSAGGTFPWQTLPEPLHPLHHALPMTYAVDGIRRLMYGGSLTHLGLDLVVLGAYVVGAFLLSTWAARKAAMWSAARIKPDLAI